ncbi:MAG TPA: hypothetical protein PKD55_22855, partial [Bellilinea sp.]|nr:hypothetical protein [Bellilinea sp.]
RIVTLIHLDSLVRPHRSYLDPDDHRPDNHVRLWRKWKLRQRQGYRKPDRQRQIEGMGAV